MPTVITMRFAPALDAQIGNLTRLCSILFAKRRAVVLSANSVRMTVIVNRVRAFKTFALISVNEMQTAQMNSNALQTDMNTL